MENPSKNKTTKNNKKNPQNPVDELKNHTYKHNNQATKHTTNLCNSAM